MRRILLCLFLLPLLSSCACLEDFFKKKPDDAIYLKATDFAKLPGWMDDNLAEALPPLQKSCKDIVTGKDGAAPFGSGGYAGTKADWKEACSALSLLLLATNDEARQYFETYFRPYEIWGGSGREGLFTGYYEPTLHGSYKKKKPYIYPLYGRPKDLITVNLGDFKKDLGGETIMGRVDGEKLTPYYTRAEIENGALKKQKQEIVWVDNAVDAFFLHIQGSGQVQMTDGTVLHVGYAAKNGRAYTAIGKSLIEKGALTKDNVSMQTIRAWLETHPLDAEDVMNINESYVFFRSLKGEGPLGAEGVPLTPYRSMAVDRKKIPYGAPLWVAAQTPEKDGVLRQMMIAQDTGGAITGAVRGDYFWGAGDDAAAKAGVMKSKGWLYILLPKNIKVSAKT